MANTTIQIKKSAVEGNTPSILANGEIAINSADGRLFYSKPNGTIASIQNQLTFGTVNANSSLVIASTTTDTLSIIPGNNVSIITDTINKTITIETDSTPTFGGIDLNNNSTIVSDTFTTSTTNQTVVDNWPIASYRSAKYEVQVTSGSNYHVIELRVLHDGTIVYLAQYGEMFTGSSLGAFDAGIAAGNMELLFTPTNAVTTVKYLRTLITL
jgi:hypothetical protein